MPSTFLTTSTGRLGAYFAGLLATNFTGQWNPHLYDVSSQTPDCFTYVFDQQQPSSGATFFHAVRLKTTAGIPQYDENTLLRLACHFILSRLPDSELQDAFRSLAEEWHYASLLASTEAEPPKRYSSLRAIAGSRRERPVFHATED